MANVAKLEEVADPRNIAPTALSRIQSLIAAGKLTPQAQIVNFDATIAQYLLTLNKNNRPLRGSNIQNLVSAIERREWRLNGASIVVSKEGELLDGQHRLAAIIHTKRVCPAIFVAGAEQKAFATIDQGRKRTLADLLGINGPSGDPTYAATVRLLYVWYNHPGSFSPGKEPVSMDQLIAFAGKLESLDHSLEMGRKCKKQIGGNVPPTIYAATHYEAMLTNEEEADDFFNALASGADLASNSPILILRNFLLRYESGSTTKHRRYLVAVFAKAWNAWRDGKPLKQLRFAPNEEFPEFL